MPSRVLSALRFGLGTLANTMVDALGVDGLTPLSLAAIYGELFDSYARSIEGRWCGLLWLARVVEGQSGVLG